MSSARIGLSVPPQLLPADIPAYARRAESAGFDELWLAEDCFFAGGNCGGTLRPIRARDMAASLVLPGAVALPSPG